MALQLFPGQVGYKAYRYSSESEAMAKFTDKNHLSTLIPRSGPSEYDRGVIDLWTQTSSSKNDFISMINKSTPFYTDTETFSWKITAPRPKTKITEVPTTTANNANAGKDHQPFDVVFSDNYFQLNDIITADNIFGDKYMIVSGPHPHSAGYLYSAILTGDNVTQNSVVDKKFLQPDINYDKIDNITGEFDTTLSGLPGLAGKIEIYQSLSAGYGVEHTITSWADSDTLRDSKGRPLDIIVYDQYKYDPKAGKQVYTGTRWEPFVERRMRDEMMKMRVKRMLFGSGGSANTLAGRQENKNITTGIIPLMMRHGHYVPFNKGDFSLNLFRDTFGDLFYRRVSAENRRVKLYANEAGMRLFQQANKEDLLNSGLTIVADSRFIEGTGRDMMVNYGFNRMTSNETGIIEVSHLMELDEAPLNPQLSLGKMADPIFIAFDISDGGPLKNIREVRKTGEDTMTWGYINGRRHHLGAKYSRGMNSASSDPGYKIWMEDRSDIFIEDFTKTVIFIQLPQF